MWHVSIAAFRGGIVPANYLAQLAQQQLLGVGNPLREWQQFTPRAFHLRRRLTREEMKITGKVSDLRKTEAGYQRLEAIKNELPPAVFLLALQESGWSE